MKNFNQFNQMLNENIYNIEDLAELISRSGHDEEYLLIVLKNIYEERGTDGVVKFVNDMAKGDIVIDSIAKGKFILKF